MSELAEKMVDDAKEQLCKNFEDEGRIRSVLAQALRTLVAANVLYRAADDEMILALATQIEQESWDA